MEDSGKISIKPELTISGDLDFRYGNIDFIGKVIVSGDVLQGLNIKAGKGIEVRGVDLAVHVCVAIQAVAGQAQSEPGVGG